VSEKLSRREDRTAKVEVELLNRDLIEMAMEGGLESIAVSVPRELGTVVRFYLDAGEALARVSPALGAYLAVLPGYAVEGYSVAPEVQAGVRNWFEDGEERAKKLNPENGLPQSYFAQAPQTESTGLAAALAALAPFLGADKLESMTREMIAQHLEKNASTLFETPAPSTEEVEFTVKDLYEYVGPERGFDLLTELDPTHRIHPGEEDRIYARLSSIGRSNPVLRRAVLGEIEQGKKDLEPQA